LLQGSIDLLRRLIIVACIVAAGAVCLWGAARFLIVNAPAASDIIVVIAGENGDGNFRKALDLFQQGYGKQILLDENTDLRVYGFARAQLAEEFVEHVPGTAAGKVHVCPILGDSTFEEATHVDKCVSLYGARSVLLVTSDYHTRRTLATFKRILPRYDWSVAASEDSAEFGKDWWEHRQWAKQTVTEWSRFIWWEAVDRW
jgi:hypothetical protein